MDDVFTINCVGNRRLELHRRGDGNLLMKINLHKGSTIKTLANLQIDEGQWEALQIALEELRP